MKEPESAFVLTCVPFRRLAGFLAAKLLGTTVVLAPGGVASFTDLAIQGPGSAYMLNFNSSYLYSAVSEQFDVDYEVWLPPRLTTSLPPSLPSSLLPSLPSSVPLSLCHLQA